MNMGRSAFVFRLEIFP